MASVLITVPTTGWVHKHAASTLQKLLLDTRGHQVRTMLPTHRPFENNLAHIQQDIRDSDDVDYWVSFDSDNPPRQNPLDLIDLGLDLVGCPTPVWHHASDHPAADSPIYWNAYDYVPDVDAYRPHTPRLGLQEVDAIGTGCFVMSRAMATHPGLTFMRTWLPDGRVEKGNDIAFCERARRAGFKIHAHYGYLCHHFVELDLCEVIAAYARTDG